MALRPARPGGRSDGGPSGVGREEDQVQGQAVHLRSGGHGDRLLGLGDPSGPGRRREERPRPGPEEGRPHRHGGAGAPRYNVTLTDGSVFFFGCSWGDVVGTMVDSQGDMWNRVRFTTADAVYSGVGPTTVWPGFGVAQAQAVHVVFDEGTDVGPGFVRLDNLDLNGKLMGKPGNSKN